MPNTREKLIELIASKVCDTYSEACEEWLPHDCGKCYANNCHIAEIADHLIANGVVVSKMETATIATDNPVGDKLTPTAKDTNVPSKWIPVTERLPDRDGQYLCNYHFGEHRAMTFTRVLDYYATDKVPHFQHTLGDITMKVTHWMPLPAPPKGE